MTDEEHAAVKARLKFLSTPAGELSWERDTRAVIAECNLLFDDTLTYAQLQEMTLDELNRKYPKK